MSASMVGRTLGRYEITGEIGRGGMGIVYSAIQTSLNRTVALKMLPLAFSQTPELLGRFRREAETLARLSHENVVHVYDVEETDGNPFIVMELVSGPSLGSMLRGFGPIPPAVARDIALAVASGLGAAHRDGIIHRDIKPDNILFTPSGKPKLTDFGIARVEDPGFQTQTGSLLGTPQYIAPEQANGERASERSDVYSLGVVLYEMVSGDRPFQGKNAIEIYLKHIQEPIPLLGDTVPGTPAALAALVTRCLQKEPARRPSDGLGLAQELEALDLGEISGRALRSWFAELYPPDAPSGLTTPGPPTPGSSSSGRQAPGPPAPGPSAPGPSAPGPSAPGPPAPASEVRAAATTVAGRMPDRVPSMDLRPRSGARRESAAGTAGTGPVDEAALLPGEGRRFGNRAGLRLAGAAGVALASAVALWAYQTGTGDRSATNLDSEAQPREAQASGARPSELGETGAGTLVTLAPGEEQPARAQVFRLLASFTSDLTTVGPEAAVAAHLLPGSRTSFGRELAALIGPHESLQSTVSVEDVRFLPGPKARVLFRQDLTVTDMEARTSTLSLGHDWTVVPDGNAWVITEGTVVLE